MILSLTMSTIGIVLYLSQSIGSIAFSIVGYAPITASICAVIPFGKIMTTVIKVNPQRRSKKSFNLSLTLPQFRPHKLINNF